MGQLPPLAEVEQLEEVGEVAWVAGAENGDVAVFEGIVAASEIVVDTAAVVEEVAAAAVVELFDVAVDVAFVEVDVVDAVAVVRC